MLRQVQLADALDQGPERPGLVGHELTVRNDEHRYQNGRLFLSQRTRYRTEQFALLMDQTQRVRPARDAPQVPFVQAGAVVIARPLPRDDGQRDRRYGRVRRGDVGQHQVRVPLPGQRRPEAAFGRDRDEVIVGPAELRDIHFCLTPMIEAPTR